MPNNDQAEERGKTTTRTKDVAPRTVGRAPGPAPRGTPRSRRLEDRTVAELRQRAKALDINGRSKMNKEELVDAIRRKNG